MVSEAPQQKSADHLHAEESRTGDTSVEADNNREDAVHHRTAITAAFSVGSAEFELGRAVATTPVSRIEFDQSLSSGEGVRSQFRVETADADALETTLGEVGSIETVTRVEGGDTESLFQIEWGERIDGLIGHLFACEARMLDVTGTPDGWQFDCQFEDGDQLSAFHEACLDDEILVEVLRLQQ